MAEPKNSKTRWEGISIAELLFFETFGAVLSAGRAGDSMLQATKLAGITYSYAHKTLNRLETPSRFGRTLVDRTAGKLTRDGEEALAYARKVLSAYRFKPFRANRFTLRIAATNRILTTMLAPYFSTFIGSYKEKTGNDIDIEILEATFDRVLDYVEIGEVELAFGGGNQREIRRPKLVSRPLRSDLHFVLIAPRKGMFGFNQRRLNEQKKLNLTELKRASVCLIRRDYRDSFFDQINPDLGFSRIIVDNYSSVIAMVRAEAAVGLVVDYGIPNDLLKFPLAESHVSKQNYAVWQHVDTQQSEAAKTLWDVVVNKTKSESTKKKG